jgi:hypothetical protein
MGPLRGPADQLDRAGEALARLRPDPPDPPVAVDDGAGMPGDVTGALRRQVDAALHARAREAEAAAAALHDLATRLREAAAGYTDTDALARSRVARTERP